ncbi:hypothetical protein C7212DRAFT_361323 [Tuber magnatum]|uniref:Uncharacterized protein n=1 Tax=Tuber magnatum TaxID=42249 RepID=A0A317T4V9_9PEZI|nr:hypothetical protein C7212DRAFT_361323 [Tuber magnatum]
MPRKPPTPRPGLTQTRLAGPNHHTIKNVREKKSSKSPAPPRQSALSSFGFRKEVTTTSTTTTSSSSGGGDGDGKKRVYASDDEIAETQFGFATQSFEGEEMGPPETPKRRRRREVPSSHSPPLSPWTPKGTTGGRIPFQLKEEEGGGEEERVVKSSQWWENEELCISTQRSGGEEVLNPFGTLEPTIANSFSPSASPSASPSPSFPTREIKREDQSPSLPSPSPQTTQGYSQVNIKTTTTQIPINFRDTPVPPAAADANEPAEEESQEPQLPYHQDDDGGGDEILPPSPTQSMGEDEFEKDDGGDDGDDIDPDGLHAFNPVRTQQLPSSFYHRGGRESSPPELPAVLTGGFSSQGLPVGEELDEETEGKRVEEEKQEEVEEEGPEEVSAEEERGGRSRRRRPITVSQLLPSSLMETFPLPPSLSQFSSYGYEVVPGSETQ